MNRRWTAGAFGIACVALAAAGAAAEQQPEAIEILKKVDAAAKAVESVRYEARTEGEGAAQFAPVEGEVVMSGWTGNRPKLMFARAKTTDAEGKPVEVSGGGNGDEFFVMDHGKKKAWVDMDPAVFGTTGQPLGQLLMAEFVHGAPFDDELGADTVEIVGKETIAGEPCTTIRVLYSGGRGESIWSFSDEDFLPRRRVVVFSGPQGDGKVIRTITSIDTSPKLDQALFALNAPEGFETIEDFAP